MASQRHKREQHFQDKESTVEPAPPQDSADETAEQYDELPSWPDEDRPTAVN